MKIKKRIINIKNPLTGEWESIPALQGEKGADGKDGLTTAIKLNGETYVQNNGTIELPEIKANCKVAWGTCDTEKAIAEKVVVIDDPNWKLEVGSLITVRFSATNSASNVTLNVNNTGAYSIRASASSPYTGSSSTYCGYANRAYTYMFDGSYWQWISSGVYPSAATNVSLGQGYVTCSTAASTIAKTASLSSYALAVGGIVAVKFTYDVPASATLNINSRGAKAIYHKGAAIADGVIKAGDTATFIYSTQYHLISIDRDETFSGDYNDLTNAPTIPTKVSQLTNDSGYLTSIPSAYVTDSELNSKGYATQTFVQNEIAKIDTTVDIVDSVEEMTDTSNQYVYSVTNTWWKCKKVTAPAGSVLPNVNNAINWSTTSVVLNKRINSSYAEVDAPGSAIFYFTFDDEMKDILNTIDPVWIRMKGCSMYTTTGNLTSTKVAVWKSGGTQSVNASPHSQILMYAETKDGISDTPYPSSIFNYSDNKTAPVTAIKFGYINTTVDDNSTNTKSYAGGAVDGKFALSLIVNFASTTAITEADLEDVYITFNEPIVSYEDTIVEYWYDTGIVYNAGDDSTVVDLGLRVSELEDRVEELENSSVGGDNTNTETTTPTLPDYWKTRLDEIGEKIEALQMENGMDTLQFLWCSDIHGVPGTSPSNTTYIGDIGRYVMDKHNIPFFMVSGDIMSQASHGSTANIWNEYAKLTPMLSPIDNEEFLAVKGNHDGAWGSPMEYNGVANSYYHSYIGDKALFNAFMRRQTLDSHRRVFDTSGMYFYVDYHDYRIYMLNSHTFGDDSVNEQGQAVYNGFKQDVFGSKQLQWIADTLMTVKESQQVIFVAHAPITYMVDKDVFTNMLVYYRNRDSYTASVDVSGTYWASGTEYSTSTVTKDFTNAKGDFMGYFNGHIHNDTISMVNIIPMFSITCAGGDVRDSYYTNGTLTREKGTATETAIDVVTVTSDFVYFTRIGSGYDRKFNRATNEVTIDYDSAFIPEEEVPEEEVLTQGEITSEVTWTADTRLSGTDGSYKEQTDSSASSDISVEPGDIIRVYGFTKKGNYLYVASFKDGALSSYISLESVNESEAKNISASYKDNILTVQIKEDAKCDTIRIANYCKDPSVLRVFRNAEMSTEPVTQGEITSKVTWTANKRLSSSSGGYSDLTGSYASSDIPCTNGDIIRLYNVSSGVNYNYVTLYGSSYITFVDVIYDGESYSNDYITASRVDGVTTITIKHDSVAYIRVCSNGGIDPSTVRITINMEL